MGLKLIRKPSEISKAETLFKLHRERLAIEKIEDELKQHFKTSMEKLGVNALAVGGFVLTLDDGHTTMLDKEKLFEDLGADALKQYKKIISFKILKIRETKSAA